MFMIGRGRSSSNTGGTLSCTWCNSTALKFVDHYPPDRDVYRCRKCGQKLTYITTPMAVDDPARMQHKSEHPYKHMGGIATKIPILGKLGKIPIINKNKPLTPSKPLGI